MELGRQYNSLKFRGQGRPVATPLSHHCQKTAMRSNLLKGRVARRIAADGGGRVPEQVFKQAATEAEALAWSTPYPLLFLPVLMEEKVEGARRWVKRQREILERQKAPAPAA